MDTPRRRARREHPSGRRGAGGPRLRRERWIRAIASSLLCPLLWIGASCTSSPKPSGYGRTLYSWSDTAGTVRYTTYRERIPKVRLHTVQPVIPGRSAAENAALFPGGRIARGARAAEPAAVEVHDDAHLADLDRRIAELEVGIARDEEAIKILISDPDAAPGLRSSPELSEIAARLPARQAELRALRQERARIAGGHEP